MIAMLALVAGLLLGLTPLLILDAIARRRFKEVSFYVVVAILSATISFTCLNELSDPISHPHYLNLAAITGNLCIGLFAAWAMSTPKRKKKSLGRNKVRK